MTPARLAHVVVLLLISLNSVAQNEPIIDGVYERQSVTEVLSSISKAHNQVFAYDSYELAKYKGTWEFYKTPLSIALEKLLGDISFSFKRMDETWIIYPVSKGEQRAVTSSLSSGFISGKVYDVLTGERLPFAAVALLRAGEITTADEFGAFSFSLNNVESGDTLAVSYVGYSSLKVLIESNAQSKEVLLGLAPNQTLLGDVFVEGRKTPPVIVPPSTHGMLILPNEEHARYGLGEADLFRIAQQRPGVAGSLENSNGLVIRGGAADQCQLLMDGFTIYHLDHFFGMFSAVNAYAVKTMRLMTGVTDVTYGGRASGVLELLGREGDMRKPSARIELGSLSVSGAVEAPLDSTGKASLFICGRQSITNRITSPAFSELFNTLYSSSVVYAGAGKIDAFKGNFRPIVAFGDINAKLTYRPSEKTRIHLSLYASRDDMDFAYADTAGNELLDVIDVRYSDETAKMNRGLSMRWQQQYSQQLQSFTNLGLSQFEGNYFSTDSIRNNLFLLDTAQFTSREITLKDLSFRHHFQWNLGRHEWKFGGEFSSLRTTNEIRTNAALANESDYSALVYTVFVGDHLDLTKNWNLQFGTRINYFEPRNHVYAEPRFALHWSAIPNFLRLRLTAAQTVQFIQRISSQNLYQNAPDVWTPAVDSIPVLKSAQVAAGFSMGIAAWSLDVEAYRKWNSGQVTNAAAFQINGGANGLILPVFGDADFVGLDMQLQWSTDRHRLALAYGGMMAGAKYPQISTDPLMESFYRNHEIKTSYEWNFKGWNLSAIQVMSNGAPYTALAGFYVYQLPGDEVRVIPMSGKPNTARAPNYYRTDVVAAYTWDWGAQRFTAQVAMYNIFNRTNIRSTQYLIKPTSDGSKEYTVLERDLRMIGRMPSLHLIWQF